MLNFSRETKPGEHTRKKRKMFNSFQTTERGDREIFMKAKVDVNKIITPTLICRNEFRLTKATQAKMDAA